MKVLRHFRDCRLSSSKPILSFLVYIYLFARKMVGGQDINMTKSSKSKLDAIMNTLTMLSMRTAEIEKVIARLHNDGTFGIAQPRIH